jgi:two-component system phosphate regulon sensor histidine kinase PhoR
MDETNPQIEIGARSGTFGASATRRRPTTWSMSGRPEPQTACSFEAMLLAIAAHDLRQPLQTMQIAIERLGIGLRTNSELYLLHRGQSAIDQMAGQLAQLFGAFLLHQQAKEIKLSPVHIQPLLRQACLENQETAVRKGVGIRVGPTRAVVMSDALLLSAVLRNLVSNAIKFTETGGQILLGCRRSGQNVQVDVLDTGIGISDEQMPRIFEAFTRADTAQQHGLGIGLFIVRTAIGLLGHRIDVSSIAGRGSRFSVFAARAGQAAHAGDCTAGYREGSRLWRAEAGRAVA